MYKLTIRQTKTESFQNESKKVTYESRQEVTYESETIGLLVDFIVRAEQLGSNNTEYMIERVVE